MIFDEIRVTKQPNHLVALIPTKAKIDINIEETYFFIYIILIHYV